MIRICYFTINWSLHWKHIPIINIGSRVDSKHFTKELDNIFNDAHCTMHIDDRVMHDRLILNLEQLCWCVKTLLNHNCFNCSQKQPLSQVIRVISWNFYAAPRSHEPLFEDWKTVHICFEAPWTNPAIYHLPWCCLWGSCFQGIFDHFYY